MLDTEIPFRNICVPNVGVDRRHRTGLRVCSDPIPTLETTRHVRENRRAGSPTDTCRKSRRIACGGIEHQPAHGNISWARQDRTVWRIQNGPCWVSVQAGGGSVVADRLDVNGLFFRHVKHTHRGTDDGFPVTCYIPGYSQARRKIVGIDFVKRIGLNSGLYQSLARGEIAKQIVLLFDRRNDFVTQTQVDGDCGKNPPVILSKPRVRRIGYVSLNVADENLSLVGISRQKVFEPGRSGERTYASVSEDQITLRGRECSPSPCRVPKFAAKLEQVFAPRVRNAVGKLVGIALIQSDRLNTEVRGEAADTYDRKAARLRPGQAAD